MSAFMVYRCALPVCAFVSICLCGCEEINFTGVGSGIVVEDTKSSSPGEGSDRVGDGTGGGEGETPDGGRIPGPGPQPKPDSIVDSFLQNQNDDSYDFLWVFDNSASMASVRQFVRDNLNGFLQTLQSRKAINYQMALTTTDFFSHGGALVRSSNDEKVVKSTDSNAVSKLDSIIGNVRPSNPDTSFWEQGLESSVQAIVNEGNAFIRPGVPLIITYLTNEDDYSCFENCFGPEPENPNRSLPVLLFPRARYQNFFRDLKDRKDKVIFYAITSVQGESCSNPSYGSRYQAIQEAQGTGATVSICPNELPKSFARIAEILSDRGACFELSRMPTAKSLQVKINGSSTTAYQYDGAKNRVCLDPIPANGSAIELSYLSDPP